MNCSKTELTQSIKAWAKELGFSAVGISRARQLNREGKYLQAWLDAGMHGEMHYMQKHYEKRTDPRQLVEGSRSVISVLHNYFPEKELPFEDNYRIAKYAYGKDYHLVIRDKLHRLLTLIQDKTGKIKARAFTDSAPMMDKVWARESGLGWIGKNTCLINKEAGSFCFIGHLVTDLELACDDPYDKDHCGSCDRCIKACPTGAIISPYQLDARKCISYLTIEYRKAFPAGDGIELKQWIFGCDICQDVCPWNSKIKKHEEEEFRPSLQLMQMQKDDWDHLTEEKYNELFKHSAVLRATYNGLMRNIRSAANQRG